MVQLTRIYTRGGDKGKTSLGNGKRVGKDDLRVEAYGTVDEANAVLGLARSFCRQDGLKGRLAETEEMLMRIQNDLFDLGADLCFPEEGAPEGCLRIISVQVERLETEIDRMNAVLDPLKSFILPGGSVVAAQLHLARTVTRRAERAVTTLMQREAVNVLALSYLNRLSDHLFVLARYVAAEAGGDILWVPGAHRGGND